MTNSCGRPYVTPMSLIGKAAQPKRLLNRDVCIRFRVRGPAVRCKGAKIQPKPLRPSAVFSGRMGNQPQRTQRNAEENLSEEQEVVSLLRMFYLLMQPMLVTGPKCLTSNLKGAGD